MKLSSKLISVNLRFTSSDTRIPLPYKTSSIAIFRYPVSESVSIAFIKLSTSSGDNITGSFLPILGVSISDAGFLSTMSFIV